MSHKAKFGEVSATQMGQVDSASVNVQIHTVDSANGPVLSIEPPPMNHAILVSLEKQDCAPDPMMVQAEGKKPGQPTINIDGTGRIWLSLNPTDKHKVEIGPCELFGFWKGDFTVIPLAQLKDLKSGLPFILASGVVPCGLGTEGQGWHFHQGLAPHLRGGARGDGEGRHPCHADSEPQSPARDIE